jgi:hypothetical protein
MLTKEQKAIVRKAAALIDSGTEKYSCLAISQAENGSYNETDLSMAYPSFFGLSEDDLQSAITKETGFDPVRGRELRVNLLLMFAEAG